VRSGAPSYAPQVPDPLSPDDAALVLRRAAELDMPTPESHDALEEQVVRDAAREVGLSDAAVEQAVQEWRAGVLAPLPELSADRRLGLLATVVVETRVLLPPEAARERLDAWLQGQWFERRRTRGQETEWAPRSGLVASTRRSLDVQHRLRLSGVGRVHACVAPAAAGSRVRVAADLGSTRAQLLAGMVAGPAVAVGTGIAVVTGAGDALPEVLLALPAALGAGGLGWLGASQVLTARRARVEEELERVLDELATAPPRRGLQDRALTWASQRLPRALR